MQRLSLNLVIAWLPKNDLSSLSIYNQNKLKRMHGLRNLVPKGVLCDENYTVLKKKSEEYRRSINYFTGHIHQMVQVHANYYQLLEASLSEASNELQTSKDATQQLFVDLIRLFCGMNGELRKFVEKAYSNEKSFVEFSNVFMTDLNILIEDFQARGKDYFQTEQNLTQTCKKYFISYKDMMSKIEAYKNTFLDVKLVYNNEEKFRLYNDCVLTYKKLEEMARLIQIKVNNLSKRKEALAEGYKVLERQPEGFTTSFVIRYIEELKKIYEGLYNFERNRLALFSERILMLEKSPFPSFFEAENNLNYQEFIAENINPAACQMMPSFVVYSMRLKEEGVFRFRGLMVVYLQEMTSRAERRRRLGRKMLEFIRSFLKGLEKSLTDSVKQTMQYYEKMKRKIGQAFGSRWGNFYQIIATILQNYVENTKKLVERTIAIVQKIENYAAEESNMMGDFLRDLKAFVDKHVHKKILKLYSSDIVWKPKNLINEEKAITQEDIYKYSQNLKSLVLKYSDSGAKMYDDGREVYRSFVGEVKEALRENCKFFREVQNTHYSEEEYGKTYQQFKDQMSVCSKKGVEFFKEIHLAVIIRETGKVVFDSEFNKLQGFKKLKKPKQFEELEDKYTGEPNSDNTNSVPRCSMFASESFSYAKKDPNDNIQNKQAFLGENSSRHAQFLVKKIIILPEEKYIKSFNCSFSDSVILAGRLYVTSHRLCFYSKFNSSNVFFGETFINVPKTDIKKVEKRSMTMFSDHAISVTTLHGCMVFRSFFSRNQAYGLIRKHFEINNQEIFFIEDEGEEVDFGVVEPQLNYEDDLKEEAAKEREEKMVRTLGEFNYINNGEEQFTSPGLTVIKFLKLFELDQEVVVSRTTYDSFLHYFKSFCSHTAIKIEPWTPNPLEYLNMINIKEGSPETFTRKVTAMVPLPPSGIPFMPKESLTFEEQTMHLVNGQKVVIEYVIKSSGVPFCDTFDVRFKRIIQSAGENKVRVSSFVFINFNQSVMVKSTIESKGIASTKESERMKNDEIKTYLKALEKKGLRSGRKESVEGKVKEQEEIITELEDEITTLKQEGKALQLECTKLQDRANRTGIAILVLFLVVLLQTIILAN